MNITTRLANGFDAARIAELLLSWFKETDIKYPGLCNYSHVWLSNFIYNHPCFVVLVDDKIVGTVGMRYGNFPWNNEYQAYFCEFLIVDENYRINGIATKLIEEVKTLSDISEAPVFMGIMTGNYAGLKDRFLSMNGFKFAGSNFVYGV